MVVICSQVPRAPDMESLGEKGMTTKPMCCQRVDFRIQTLIIVELSRFHPQAIRDGGGSPDLPRLAGRRHTRFDEQSTHSTGARRGTTPVVKVNSMGKEAFLLQSEGRARMRSDPTCSVTTTTPLPAAEVVGTLTFPG